jgi:predicted PurR-regulated permease PerM
MDGKTCAIVILTIVIFILIVGLYVLYRHQVNRIKESAKLAYKYKEDMDNKEKENAKLKKSEDEMKAKLENEKKQNGGYKEQCDQLNNNLQTRRRQLKQQSVQQNQLQEQLVQQNQLQQQSIQQNQRNGKILEDNINSSNSITKQLSNMTGDVVNGLANAMDGIISSKQQRTKKPKNMNDTNKTDGGSIESVTIKTNSDNSNFDKTLDCSLDKLEDIVNSI